MQEQDRDRQGTDRLFSSLAERTALREGDPVLTASQYNRAIGLCLLYGFGVNALITFATQKPLERLMLRSPDSFRTLLIVFLVAYLALCLGGSRLLNRGTSVRTCFAGYSMIVLPMGLLISLAVMPYDFSLVNQALTVTAIVTGIMMLLSMWKPDFFLRIGPALGIALLASIGVEILSTFVLRWLSFGMDWVVVTIMALYVGFDWARANALPTTSRNAVVISASLYLDIVNIFLRVLSIISRSKSRD